MDNLMSNAVRYTPEGGTILLQAKEQKETVQFSVRDSGRGIEAERLANIFGRFNAAHDQGTGLVSPWCAAWSNCLAVRCRWRAGSATEQPSLYPRRRHRGFDRHSH